MKKLIFITYFFCMFFCFFADFRTIYTQNIAQEQEDMPDDKFFEDFFKNLFGPQEPEGSEQPLFPVKTPVKPIEKKPEEKKEPVIPEKKLTQEEYFLQAAQEPGQIPEKDPQVAKGAKTPAKPESLVKKLSKERIDAFNFYINKFKEVLAKLENKIESFLNLGILFHEDLEKINYKKIINSIKTELGQLTSKSTMKKAFFLPSQTELRKNIFDTIKELDKIELQIIKQEKKSEEEIEEDIIKELERRAEKKPVKVYFAIDKKLEANIKKLISQNLKQIQENLEKIKNIDIVKKGLDAKKKEKEKLAAQAAKQVPTKYPGYQQPTQYYPGQGQYQPSYPSSRYPYDTYGGYGGYDSFPGSYGSYQPTSHYPQDTIPETKPTESTPSTPSSGDKEKGQFFTGNTKDEESLKKIKDLIHKNIILIGEVLLDHEKDPDLAKVSFRKLSNIQKNLSQIDSLKDKTSSASQEIVKKAGEYKQKDFDDLFKKFIPLGVKLAKTFPHKKDATAVKALLDREAELSDKEVEKFEEEILKTLDITQIGPRADTDSVHDFSKKIQKLLSDPVSDNITEKLTKLGITKDLIEIEKKRRIDERDGLRTRAAAAPGDPAAISNLETQITEFNKIQKLLESIE
ncbi:hypothetical protein K9L05_00450 [Candidatus Babeliales bacterium]|nr:hypothetical protein [Candidatus Babeliales bacterium]MCF7899104.1 hypothetical protein [Candidatus Babeliales bacterium]